MSSFSAPVVLPSSSPDLLPFPKPSNEIMERWRKANTRAKKITILNSLLKDTKTYPIELLKAYQLLSDPSILYPLARSIHVECNRIDHAVMYDDAELRPKMQQAISMWAAHLRSGKDVRFIDPDTPDLLGKDPNSCVLVIKPYRFFYQPCSDVSYHDANNSIMDDNFDLNEFRRTSSRRDETWVGPTLASLQPPKDVRTLINLYIDYDITVPPKKRTKSEKDDKKEKGKEKEKTKGSGKEKEKEKEKDSKKRKESSSSSSKSSKSKKNKHQ